MKHGFFTIIKKTAINMKMKKMQLSPNLKSLSPHVVNGDKVGQRCSRLITYLKITNGFISILPPDLTLIIIQNFESFYILNILLIFNTVFHLTQKHFQISLIKERK